MENYIFGIRPILEAIKAGQEIDKVLVRNQLSGENVNELLTALRKNDINFQYVPVEKIDKITTNNHQGVIAYISPVHYHDTEDLITRVFESSKIPLLVVLDSITDVRNFGAIARTCECAGVDAIIIPSRNSVRITEDAIKTSAGALYNIPICKENNLVDTVILLQQMGIKVYAATEKAADDIYKQDFVGPSAIVFGSEDIGISNQILKRVDSLVKIPMFGKTESLNVSVSAAVCIYEVVRQRGLKSII
jgi:23S rRNA (guanosine2251-2'-O)-methyltransferase